ncbi:MAG: flagellar motor switch protein FliM, partial [Pseudomonadota bacterium]
MGDTENQTVLARITASARTERKAKAMTLQKALRVAVAKVADALMDMPAAVLSVSIQDISGEEVEATLDDAQLQLILDGPAGCIGAAMFAPVVVGAMIQQQTIGSVSPGPDPERAMTRTDAAI